MFTEHTILIRLQTPIFMVELVVIGEKFGFAGVPLSKSTRRRVGKIGSTNEQLRKGRRGGGTFDDLQQYSWSPLIWGYCNSDNKELHCGGSFPRNGQAQRYITSLFMTPDNGITTTFSKRFHIIAIGGAPSPRTSAIGKRENPSLRSHQITGHPNPVTAIDVLGLGPQALHWLEFESTLPQESAAWNKSKDQATAWLTSCVVARDTPAGLQASTIACGHPHRGQPLILDRPQGHNGSQVAV
ncbi:predicted protein [Histoplasma capsulatum var. duboisii H88]|uniref:Predicted protein n=1 Tax=Ajellomyces capsulatus (strain H88) TaxID=544711 RepID=F0USV0_AJEC8|nr:predicted protein [Histoplasma capsulatum var. duboisii H88]